MIVIKKNSENISTSTAVALGNFDGLHVGHKHLINTVLAEAKSRNLKSSVFTFNNHTTNITKHRKISNLLMNNHQKIEEVRKLGVDILYMIDFTEDIMHMSPEDFFKDIIIDKLKSKLVVIGFNFKFGHKASGNTDMLKNLGKKYSVDIIVVDPIYKENEIVSSTLIRELLLKGEIKKANNLLDKSFSIEGKVIKGKGIGKTLGFPTANLDYDTSYLIPKFGVYDTITRVDGTNFSSITNVGLNPTFDSSSVTIETHIFDYDKNIYGKEVEVSFLNYLRCEIKFSNRDELINQIKHDINCVKNKK